MATTPSREGPETAQLPARVGTATWGGCAPWSGSLALSHSGTHSCQHRWARGPGEAVRRGLESWPFAHSRTHKSTSGCAASRSGSQPQADIRLPRRAPGPHLQSPSQWLWGGTPEPASLTASLPGNADPAAAGAHLENRLERSALRAPGNTHRNCP